MCLCLSPIHKLLQKYMYKDAEYFAKLLKFITVYSRYVQGANGRHGIHYLL